MENKKTDYVSNKKKGWFSKRYQTAGAHLKAKEMKMQRVDEQVRFAVQRESERRQRTPEEQITLLDERLGRGIGAKKERGRLNQQIADAKAPKRPEDSGKSKKNWPRESAFYRKPRK